MLNVVETTQRQCWIVVDEHEEDIYKLLIITIGIKIWAKISTSVISYVIDINSYFGDKRYLAQTLKVASDLRRASGAFENPVIVIITLVIKKAQDKVVKLCM